MVIMLKELSSKTLHKPFYELISRLSSILAPKDSNKHDKLVRQTVLYMISYVDVTYDYDIITLK